MSYALFDMGGSAVKYALGDADGNLSDPGSFDASPDDFQDILENMASVCEGFKAKATIEGIAVSAPGFVDCEHGIIHGLSALPCIHEFPVAEAISKRLGGLPVSIENDGNCGALGEYWKGSAKGAKQAAMLVCGTGIGGGYVQEGQIIHTTHFSASEYGFIPIAVEDGKLRSWSDYSVGNTVKRYNEDHGTALNGKELFDLADTEEEAARYVKRFYHYLAIGSLYVAFFQDPDIIVFGGAVSKRPDFKEHLDQALEEIRQQGEGFGKYQSVIDVSKLGNDANLLGALWHFLTYGSAV